MSPRTEGVAGRTAAGKFPVPPSRGFTLVELLVSMSVLVLVMVLTVQLVGRTTSITSASNKLVDTSTMARTVFDRLGDDLGGAALTGGPTVLYYSGSTGSAIDPLQNSALGFACKTRARRLTTDKESPLNRDVRGIVVGYKIRQTAVPIRPGTTLNIPLISRGDAEFTFLNNGSAGSNGKYFFSTWDVFGTAGTTPLPTDLTATSTSSDSNLLTWLGFGDGVLRFHVSFVLDDGRIVQNVQQTGLNATYSDFQTSVHGGTGSCQPLAFSAATTADLNKHYVTGLIVGIAVLDQSTLNLGYGQDANFAANLTSQLKRPTNDGETPLSVWQANLSSVTPLPVQRSIRFYQRFYAINL